MEKGIGTKVLQRMIERAREVGLEEIPVEEIYDWNTGPVNCLRNVALKLLKRQRKVGPTR